MVSTDFDVVVIGGGHAGVEAALAATRMGATVAIVTMDPDKLALMSCNPAIGGSGKSQLVKEIDALGGLMGMAIDATGVQFRRLNLSRGPAVWSTRAQADRLAYTKSVVDFCRRQRGLQIIEGVAGEVLVDHGKVRGIRTESGEVILSKAVIVATGTFLGGLIHIGPEQTPAGRLGEPAACKLSNSLRNLGFEVGRLKTGTPPRLDGDTIDWSRCEPQPGEEPPPWFSYRSSPRELRQVVCHMTYTTDDTKRLVTANLAESPIFSGQIKSTGPRYCPSIEDKFYRFAEKDRHLIFLEPEGMGTSEIYPNGFSTALPESIQRQAIRTVIGLENAVITRPGYAVEYDYCPAYQVRPSLETRRVAGLFFAGQINGTSGYEEAGAQGIMAGINAVNHINDAEPLVLDRSEAYLGVMIDDLVTRSTTEPYRMFTSRAEYRLALREDNALDRLTRYARQYGLIDDQEAVAFEKLCAQTEQEVRFLRNTTVRVAELGPFESRFKKQTSVSLSHLLKQPGVGLEELLLIMKKGGKPRRPASDALRRAAIQIRYEGYIAKQQREIEKFKRQESEVIPDGFDWQNMNGLKNEAREKLLRFTPSSLGQASRIEGVTPGDLAVLAVHLKRFRDSPA
ncbi:MAG: tRNA uridine-5-carboxymethylaminomethyl(34) synthesis enzyme MnmG [Candidatus Zixiibacteriota bacterium]|nr:MAG: tRNA uridine-5-carboxymethylaminomethyl(34) synthesis enzyme MnmG [candidate division Zixibacteria bacterium]